MSFAEALKSARLQAGLRRAQLAGRLRVTTQQIGYWETGDRVPDADRQREILAAITAPSVTLDQLVAELQADVTARIARFAADAQGLTTAPVTADDAEEALQVSEPAAPQAAARPRARRPR